MELREITKVISVKEPKNKWNDDEGDVAFLKFDQPFTNYQLPTIGTPSQIATLKPWSLIKGYGYGTIGDGLSKYSPIPLRYELSWGNDDHAVLGTVVLIASVTSMACAGDSGGPITGILDDNQEVLIGVAASIANKGTSGCEKINPTKMYYLNFNLNEDLNKSNGKYTIVVDRSGSMYGFKMDNAKTALELFVHSLHISEYAFGTIINHQPLQERKLLLNKRELKKLQLKIKEKGYSIIPIRIFFNENGLAKMEIGLGKGKKQYDKRNTIKEREANREFKNKYGI